MVGCKAHAMCVHLRRRSLWRLQLEPLEKALLLRCAQRRHVLLCWWRQREECVVALLRRLTCASHDEHAV